MSDAKPDAHDAHANAAPGGSPAPRVVAVVVAYNRRVLLERTLTGILGGDTVPAAVVVVDNASTDGSGEMVQKLAEKRGPAADGTIDLVTLGHNTGGAGGFTVGLARALARHRPDAVWLMDDDTEPSAGALAASLRAWRDYPGGHPAFVASRVVWDDGRDHPMNTPRRRPGVTRALAAAARSVGAMPVRSASFVSLLVDAERVRRVGLPVADYFLWNDDFEFSTRLARFGAGLYLPGSVVTHHTTYFGSTDADPGERFYWEVRNKLWLFGRSRSLAPGEKALYGGATALRWARTVRRSPARRVLLRCAVRGTRDALRAAPRANRAVLGDDLDALPATRPAAPAPAGPVEFSVLLPLWRGDDPEFFARAFASVTHEQTRRPAEVVVVCDGPITPAQAALLGALRASSPVPVVEVDLPENLGLAGALDAGLAACHHEVVARMDADDISRPERFARQLPVIEAGADIVGTGLQEFATGLGGEPRLLGLRVPPCGDRDIARAARFRDPFNHPSVVYRKRAVADAGGYRDLDLMEDYWLFARMIQAGAALANIPDPLVLYRVSDGAYARRGGLRLLRSELALQGRLLGEGFVTPPQYLRNVAVRGGYRLVPEGVRRQAYRKLIALRH